MNRQRPRRSLPRARDGGADNGAFRGDSEVQIHLDLSQSLAARGILISQSGEPLLQGRHKARLIDNVIMVGLREEFYSGNLRLGGHPNTMGVGYDSIKFTVKD